MYAPLLIPWFKPDAIAIPLPFELPLFRISELKIHPFGMLVGTGVLVGMKLAENFGKRRGIAPWVVADLVWHVLSLGFLCAYFLNGLFYEPDKLVEVIANPSKLFREWLGLSSYGGFIGAVAGAALWRWKRNMSFLVVGDAVAYGFVFGWLFGRLGCFVAHDHPGSVSDFVLAVDNYNLRGLPRHDLGLYEVFWSLFAIAVYVVLDQRPRMRGLYVALLALLYAPIRFFLDFLRAEPVDGGDVRYAGLTPGQWASLATLIVGIVVLRVAQTSPPSPLPADARWPLPEGVDPPVTDADARHKRRPATKA